MTANSISIGSLLNAIEGDLPRPLPAGQRPLPSIIDVLASADRFHSTLPSLAQPFFPELRHPPSSPSSAGSTRSTPSSDGMETDTPMSTPPADSPHMAALTPETTPPSSRVPTPMSYPNRLEPTSSNGEGRPQPKHGKGPESRPRTKRAPRPKYTEEQGVFLLFTKVELGLSWEQLAVEYHCNFGIRQEVKDGQHLQCKFYRMVDFHGISRQRKRCKDGHHRETYLHLIYTVPEPTPTTTPALKSASTSQLKEPIFYYYPWMDHLAQKYITPKEGFQAACELLPRRRREAYDAYEERLRCQAQMHQAENSLCETFRVRL